VLKGRSLPSNWLVYLTGDQEATHGYEIEVTFREGELLDETGEEEVEELEDTRGKFEGEDQLITLTL
jgi:hypothetical protein